MPILYRVDRAVDLNNLQLTQTYNSCIEFLHLLFKGQILLKQKIQQKKQQYIL